MRSSGYLKPILLASWIGLAGPWSPLTAASREAAAASYSEDTDRPGDYVLQSTAKLLARPTSSSRVLRTLRRGTTIHVVDVTRGWYRVEPTRPNRPSGYIRRSGVDVAPARSTREFRHGTYRVTQSTTVHASPSRRSPSITRLRSGAKVHVVGETGSWYRIESERGRQPGYIASSTARKIREFD